MIGIVATTTKDQDRIAANQPRLHDLVLLDLVKQVFPEKPKTAKPKAKLQGKVSASTVVVLRRGSRLVQLSKPSYAEQQLTPRKPERQRAVAMATPQQQPPLAPGARWFNVLTADPCSKAVLTPVRREAAAFLKEADLSVDSIQGLDVDGVIGVTDGIKERFPSLTQVCMHPTGFFLLDSAGDSLDSKSDNKPSVL